MLLHPQRLSGSAGDQYRAAANVSRSGNAGRIVHWTEAVQHLLRTYETEATISDAIEDFMITSPN